MKLRSKNTRLGEPAAPSKLAIEMLPAYEPDGGPLTAKQLAALRDDAAQHLPKGKTLFKQVLFS